MNENLKLLGAFAMIVLCLIGAYILSAVLLICIDVLSLTLISTVLIPPYWYAPIGIMLTVAITEYVWHCLRAKKWLGFAA